MFIAICAVVSYLSAGAAIGFTACQWNELKNCNRVLIIFICAFFGVPLVVAAVPVGLHKIYKDLRQERREKRGGNHSNKLGE
jgi:hypothetical protein